MDKRLIPYSVHLPEDIFNQLKTAAAGRKAAGLVRDAIVSFIENGDLYKQGYAAGVRAAIAKVGKNKVASSIAVDGVLLRDSITKDLDALIK